ncbi:MAG: ROK family protein [Methanocellales archaeon]
MKARELIVSMDCGGTYIKAALVDCEGNIVCRRKCSTEAERGMRAVVKNLVSTARGFAVEYKIAGVALGMAGAIDFKNGILLQSPNFAYSENFPLKAELERELALPVFLENDANAYAMGEKWIGAGRGFSSLLCLTIGTGVGGGIILNNELWRGIDGTAGELGHVTIYPDGLKCKCGNLGCLEAYISAGGIMRMAKKAKHPSTLKQRQNITPQLVYEAALRGDLAAVEIWQEVGRILGIGLATFVNIFNVEAIIIGGGIASAYDFFIESAKLEMRKRAFKVPAERIKLLKAELGDDAGILGAAYIAWQALKRRAKGKPFLA